MKKLCLLVLLSLCGPVSGAAENKPAPATKSESPSTLSTEIYEKESSQEEMTDTVKILREMDGRSEVLFVKRAGVFTAPDDGLSMEKLIESQKSKSAVHVTFDGDSQKIHKVTSAPEKNGK